MAQIQKGTTYITGDQVTAANLNALADSAILLPGAITDQTAKTVPLAADTVLIHSAADTALRKSTLTQVFANATGIPISTGISGLGSGVATFLATPSSANLAAAVSDETGSGALVFATSPSLTSPNLGTPTAAVLTSATGLPLTTGVTGTLPVANGGTGVTTSTGTTNVVLSNSPTLVTPVLGTPSSGTLTSCTGLPLSTGVTGTLPATNGGTGVSNASTITVAGNLTHAGAFTQSFTATANTALTLPTTGTLATLAGTEALSNKTITASAFNGTVGATTPSTVAATTIAASGTITGGDLIQMASTTNANRINVFSNVYGLGIDSTDLVAYANTGAGFSVKIGGSGYNSTLVTRTTSTGLAVTGTLSATGGINSTAIGATTPSTGAFTTLTAVPTDVTTQRFLVGDTTARASISSVVPIVQITSSNSTYPALGIFRYSADAAASLMVVNKSRSATAGSHSAVQASDSLFSITTAGSDGTNFVRSSAITFLTPTTFTTGAGYGSISFRVTNASDSLVEVAQVNAAGLAVTGTLSATGVISAQAGGSAAAPSITFLADTDTGLARTTANSFIGSCGGAAVFVVSTTGFAVTGALSCTGALSKGSGSFRIEHPLPEKSATHQLVHSFIEGPKCDLIYRGKINLVNGKASVNIDADSTMTEGTFEALCANVQCFTSNESGWGAIRGKVTGNILTIEAQDSASTDNVSWMVIGERKDKHIMDTDWTDDNGRPIVEPLKPVELALESN